MSLVLVLPKYQQLCSADPSTQNAAGLYGLSFTLTVIFISWSFFLSLTERCL